MRIRFFNTYEPVTTFYRDLLPALAQAGNQVEVYISAAEYRSGRGSLAGALRRPGLKIRSFPVPGFAPDRRLNKAWIMLSYAFQAAIQSLVAQRADFNFFLSQPPLFAAWGWALKVLRGQRFFCLLMDLYPEAAVRAGILRENGLPARALGMLARFIWKQADGIVVIGRCQRERLIRAGVPKEKIHFIPNWVSDGLIHPVAPSRNRLRKNLGLEDSFVVLYSGNMGIAHEFRTLLDAAERLRSHSRIHFVLIGDGARRPELEMEKRARQLNNVTLLPFQRPDRLAESLSLGDVHIVTLRNGFEGVVVPSKAYGAPAAARPLIYVGHRSGEIARMVTEARIGVVVPAGAGAGLARAILKYSRSPSLHRGQARRAIALYQERYHPRNSLRAYQQLINGRAHDQ